MPKLKTKKALRKRFRITKKGKVKMWRAFKRHLLSKKSRKRKRALSHSGIVSKSDEKTLKRLLPYG